MTVSTCANVLVFVGVLLQGGGVWWTLRALVKDSPREALELANVPRALYRLLGLKPPAPAGAPIAPEIPPGVTRRILFETGYRKADGIDPVSLRLSRIEEALRDLHRASLRHDEAVAFLTDMAIQHETQIRTSREESRQHYTSTAAGQLRVNLGSLPYILGGFALVVLGELIALLGSIL